MEKILVMVARILFLGIFILPYAVQTHIEKKEGNERDPIEDRHALTPGAKVLAFLAILLALTLDGLVVYASPDKRRIYFGLAMRNYRLRNKYWKAKNVSANGRR